ncbi:hypothetical protein HBA_0587 [Sodalis endosymbiont of Henestaris halophilus]|nr:hypothetical protein HBA_0587 [Sodalis endosymbiont of Henestaris halophilus]
MTSALLWSLIRVSVTFTAVKILEAVIDSKEMVIMLEAQ